jgi:hypothetical protein
MQAVMLNAMDMTLMIERPTNGVNAWLINTETWTQIVTGVRCLLSDPSDAEMDQKQPGPIGAQLQWDVWVPNGTNVQENDRVTLNNGQVLRVQSVHSPRTTYFMLDSFLASAVR